jgi:regulation of enolase protein 1 (concanavalin A-like superfamily)
MWRPLLIAFVAIVAMAERADTTFLFEDQFKGKLGQGWSWIRENPKGWRVSTDGLEIRVEPGNMWGPSNDARNVLVRNAPNPGAGAIEICATFENRPTEQYEQVDLVWYYDDSHMVKLGQEMVDGQLSIVMGREEKDRTRTIAIIPLKAFSVSVRILVTTNLIRGQFRPEGATEWQDAGNCDLPVKGSPKISIQAYQGPAKAEHWARITEFRIAQAKE